VDAAAFALRLAALIDGLAVLVVLKDPEVTRERMFDLCMETCAGELDFTWSAQDRAAVVRGMRHRARARRGAGGGGTAMAVPCSQVRGSPRFWTRAWRGSPLARRTTSWVAGPW